MTLLECRTFLRILLGEKSPAFWTNADLNICINKSFVEIYTEIMQANESHFATSVDVTYVAGTQLYALPAGGINRIMLVERKDQNPPIDLHPIAIADKNKYAMTTGTSVLAGYERYFLLSNTIGFTPIPASAITAAVRIYYIPEPTELVNDADNFPVELTSSHHELIAWGALLRAIAKNKELVNANIPNFNRLHDLMKADTNRRQYQEAIGFVMPDNYDS